MKKIVALILTLVLMLSFSATAFAANGETDVTVAIDSSNISVTVPLSFTITAKVDGGSATVPMDYKIINNSTIPVKVDSIAVVNNKTAKWALSATPITANTDQQNAGVNDLYLSINGQVMAVQAATAPTTATSWNIGAGTQAAGTELALAVVASTSQLDQTATETDLITITYVISAGAHS